MGEFVAVSAVVDLFGVEHLVHGAGDAGHVLHESVALLVAQLEEVVDMAVVGHQAAPAVGLLLEKKHSRHIELGYFDHQIVERLVVGAVETVFGITFHNLAKFSGVNRFRFYRSKIKTNNQNLQNGASPAASVSSGGKFIGTSL